MSRSVTLAILVSVSSAALLSCAPETRPVPLVPISDTPAAPGAQLEDAEITDQQLLQDSDAPGFAFYKGDPARLPFTPEGASFPKGSVVVKEIYEDATGPWSPWR